MDYSFSKISPTAEAVLYLRANYTKCARKNKKEDLEEDMKGFRVLPYRIITTFINLFSDK
jgi:hypothetical protein